MFGADLFLLVSIASIVITGWILAFTFPDTSALLVARIFICVWFIPICIAALVLDLVFARHPNRHKVK